MAWRTIRDRYSAKILCRSYGALNQTHTLPTATPWATLWSRLSALRVWSLAGGRTPKRVMFVEDGSPPAVAFIAASMNLCSFSGSLSSKMTHQPERERPVPREPAFDQPKEREEVNPLEEVPRLWCS
jgi:hypothetical protein